MAKVIPSGIPEPVWKKAEEKGITKEQLEANPQLLVDALYELDLETGTKNIDSLTNYSCSKPTGNPYHTKRNNTREEASHTTC